MDIAINKNIEYEELKGFLKLQFPSLDLFLVYDGLNDWEDIGKEDVIFNYVKDDDINEGFKYGLCVYIKNDDMLSIIERLSWQLSDHFKCSAFCDASRVVIKEQNPYYSLLYENGKVYLVDDYIYEDTGNITKIVELTYEYPEYKFG